MDFVQVLLRCNWLRKTCYRFHSVQCKLYNPLTLSIKVPLIMKASWPKSKIFGIHI